jgi:hypothetical protein
MRSGLTQTPYKRASLRIRLIASVVSEKGGDAYHDALARRRVTSISRAIDGDKNIFARSSVVIIRG